MEEELVAGDEGVVQGEVTARGQRRGVELAGPRLLGGGVVAGGEGPHVAQRPHDEDFVHHDRREAGAGDDPGQFATRSGRFACMPRQGGQDSRHQAPWAHFPKF